MWVLRPVRQIVCDVSMGTRSIGSKGGGTIRDGGGAFGKRERAKEDQYFWRKEKEETEALAKKLAKTKPKGKSK